MTLNILRAPTPTPTPTPARTILFRHVATAALALGVAGGVALPASPALAAPPAANYSKPFIALAAPLQKSIDEAKLRPDVVAAKSRVDAAQNAYNQTGTKAARDAAKAQLDAASTFMLATLDPQVKALDATYAAVVNADDRMAAGQLALSLGGLAQNAALQRRGIQSMIDSGKLAAAQLPKLQFYAGQFAYEAHDYAAARVALTAATGLGYHENGIDVTLAEAYLGDNQATQGLALLQQAIDRAKAAGQPVPQAWYRRGLGASYTAKQLDKGIIFAMQLVQAYPSTENWAAAIDVVRDVGRFPPQEELDLMRLMARTHSFTDQRDYIEYVQSADARRLPGEVKAVIDAGFAAGTLNNSDASIVEARSMAGGRIAADRASLPGLERDARAGGASGATVVGAGDAFLSYGEGAKAASLYQIALTRPGVDIALVQTRLGIAQADSGDYAGAQASFAKVDGPRKPLAQLWTIYVQQKAAGH